MCFSNSWWCLAKMAANRRLKKPSAACFPHLCDCCVQPASTSITVAHLWVSYLLLAAPAVISWLAAALKRKPARFEEWFENIHFNKVLWACRQDIIKQTEKKITRKSGRIGWRDEDRSVFGFFFKWRNVKWKDLLSAKKHQHVNVKHLAAF